MIAEALSLTNNTELPEPSQRIPLLIHTFLNSLDVKLSSKALYKRTIAQYFNWLKKQKLTLDIVTVAEVINYKQELLSSGMSPLSVGSYITVVRKFYQWAEANKLYPNIAKDVKTPKRKQQFKKQSLTDIQAKSLLDYYKELEGEVKRDYAIVSLLLRTGLRTIELIRANVEDITFKEGKRVLMIQGKGRDEKDNFVLLTDKTYQPVCLLYTSPSPRD